MNTETTRTQIMQHAQRLVQERGYNGFSYRDLATLIGIKTSSIHYYFPQKEDLLLAIVQQYHARWLAAIQAIDTGLSADVKLRAYVDMHRQAFCNTERICLAAALAADLASLPADIRKMLQGFYGANEDWLAQVLEQGVREGSLDMPGDVRIAARSMFAALQGSLATARLFNDSERMNDLLQAALSRQ
ncbi:TetR/AcrR family transcriptional regulator [Pollutimonas harenae]|uniref:TetR/AcrR family transcriptional regulator n=1 Tax=Pollutimonas harenae TaxID=657015 RepID=A0A853GWU2_9BURK|nr:TetR/AcrR family transcriptional regulator [Pollutimonas harenae]NYT85216.1 TetR/AcrR family transcriptional regulator [Pollutimonas harenae]TEA72413.1 TetR/AcrR family transcriptional regulator [Pollutimonas harenae]